jgi:hypothetical protein
VVSPEFDSVYFTYPKFKFLVGIKADKAALVDKVGNKLTDFKYDEIKYSVFTRQDFFIVRRNNLYGFIDSTGKEIIPTKYEKVTRFDKENTARYQLNGKWGLIDSKGTILLEPKYKLIKNFSNNGTAVVNLNDHFFHIDNKANKIYQKNFEDLKAYVDKNVNYAPAKSGGKWGVINIKGESVIPFEYEDIYYAGWRDPNKTLCFYCHTETGVVCFDIHNKQVSTETIFVSNVVSNESSERYNKKNIIVKTENDSVFISFSKNYSSRKRNYKFINEYDRLEYFENLHFNDPKELIFKIYKNGKVGLIDIFGEVIIPAKCDTLYRLKRSSEIYIFEKEGKKALFDIQKKELLTDFEFTYFDIMSYKTGWYSVRYDYIFAKRDDGFWGYLTVYGDNFFPK